jgi:hypothetical protein
MYEKSFIIAECILQSSQIQVFFDSNLDNVAKLKSNFDTIKKRNIMRHYLGEIAL